MPGRQRYSKHWSILWLPRLCFPSEPGRGLCALGPQAAQPTRSLTGGVFSIFDFIFSQPEGNTLMFNLQVGNPGKNRGPTVVWP